jgi:parallel beta-helix repeat protein
MVSIRRYGPCASLFVCSLVLAGGMLRAPVSDAATYYVATMGNDANPGTEATPFRTLNKGVKALKPGDTLYVRHGTYDESLHNNIPAGTSWSAPVKVAAFPGEQVTLRPLAGTQVIYLSGNRRYIIIEGLILDGSHVSSDGVKITTKDGTAATAAHHIRLQHVEVKHAPNQGIFVGRHCDGNEFLNLHVHHNGKDASYDHGIYLSSSRNLIKGGDWHHNKEYGIQLYRFGAGNIVRNARVYGNNQGIVSSQQADNLIANNLVYQNTRRGIVLASGNNLKAYHNTVSNNGRIGIDIATAAVTNAQVTNNIAFGHLTNIHDLGTNTTLANNLTTDPQFVDAAVNDFRLGATSPAIDTGVTLSEVTVDYASVRRPQGTGSDIGAQEYTGSTEGASLSAPMMPRTVDVK